MISAGHIAGKAQLDSLLERIKPHQVVLQEHRLYGQLSTLAAIRCFMSSHVFAVWDNMLLLKTLQQRLTCVTTPWCPSEDAIATRLINEIILDEESEEIAPGQYMSHVQFYIAAMEEIGADTRAICSLMNRLQNGEPLETALRLSLDIPGSPVSPTVREFVLHTWTICQGSTPAVAAAFLLAREAIVGPLFTQILKQLQSVEMSNPLSCQLLQAYCQRHLCVDEERHIPMGLELLSRICKDDTQAWEQAKVATISSLVVRKQLWDNLSEQMSAFLLIF
ncbi:DUF3050 domain-containing protein [Leptolyngbya cf. ectocarpi LEGE 11479]|uniref:DUF3050 domain-containing protein n=1 Tax=Leptolyngbya cf. ectocarpi LEGE 11479 TaxID=1828722 RepID=A0A928ZUE2_LEPEC|nr:DUF3050 domain-containing protein [Leptolyngbya ectocarpi]MBE9067624.1 DUF3050 domain-containing protein [Leptolyngbya cf. ectocarpi LEGE 11479]